MQASMPAWPVPETMSVYFESVCRRAGVTISSCHAREGGKGLFLYQGVHRTKGRGTQGSYYIHMSYTCQHMNL